MAKMLISWEHAEERTYERVQLAHRDRVKALVNLISTMVAPTEAQGHYSWYIDVNGGSNDLVARIIIRGIAVRTIYPPDFKAPQGSVRYRIDRANRTFVRI